MHRLGSKLVNSADTQVIAKMVMHVEETGNYALLNSLRVVFLDIWSG